MHTIVAPSIDQPINQSIDHGDEQSPVSLRPRHRPRPFSRREGRIRKRSPTQVGQAHRSRHECASQGQTAEDRHRELRRVGTREGHSGVHQRIRRLHDEAHQGEVGSSAHRQPLGDVRPVHEHPPRCHHLRGRVRRHRIFFGAQRRGPCD